MTIKVLSVRAPSGAPDTVTYWVEGAACQSLPASDFEPSLQGRHREENISVTEGRLERARRACSTCPVWTKCYLEAQPEDFFYTMRAGIEPAQFTHYKDSGYAGVAPKGATSGMDTCPSCNSNEWGWHGVKKPRRVCLPCARETKKRAYRKKRDA